MSYSKLVLPYAVEDSGRKTRFSEEMEVAALLCVGEAERKKKARIFRGAIETLTFLSKLNYPFWAIPWENNCLLIDGMETVSENILYYKLPDVEAFIEHLKRSTTVHELYKSALRSHIETFSDFSSQTEFPVDGRIADKGLLSDMFVFIKDGQAKVGNIPESAPLMEPRVDREKAVEIGEKVLEHYRRLHSEIKGLQLAIDALNEETKKHTDKLKEELQQLQEKFESKISDLRIEVEKKRKELEKELDEKIEKITAVNDKEVNTRLDERKKWEQELASLGQNKSEYEKRRELRKRKEDEIGEARWDARLKDVQNQISTVKGKIKALSDFINRTNKETTKTAKNLRDTYAKMMDEEEKKITDLESLRDSEVEKKRKEKEELQREALAISDKIEKLIDQKKERSSALSDATIPWKIETPTLIYVPFYLYQYISEKERRYRIRPPIIAKGHEGIVMKIRKRLRSYSLESKMGTLLSPRSKALERVFSSFEEKANNDKAIQRNLAQLCMENNLLTSVDFKEKVKRGIEELEVEGWVKPEESAVLLDAYFKT